MIVYVTKVEWSPGSVVLISGLEDETGDQVTFGVDHRIAADLAEAVEQQGEIPCAVEGWQIMRRVAA
jgi:hypothetical protein